MSERAEPTVAIIGAGITGLSAAWELLAAAPSTRVTLFEADRVGGKLQASPFAGLAEVDEAADAFLARVPWARALCAELGIDDLVSPATGHAYVWHGQALHAIPQGLVLGVPAGLAGLVRSRLLSPRGVARAALDLVLPRTPPHHDSLGRLIRDRFGHEVLERLVDPLVGSINAGDADQLSLRAAAPQIADVARHARSLLLALRRQQSSAPTGPVFLTPRRGLASLAATLAERVTGAGAVISAPTTVREIASDGSRWRVDGQGFDAVIVTAPAAAASSLLTSICSDAAMVLGGIPQAGVVMVGLHVARPVGPPASGYLVPKPVQRHVTAVSLASSKWAHWQPPAGGAVLRVSLGRYGNQAPMDLDDAAVVQTAVDEVGRHLGGALDVVAHRVTRWPGAFPQYLPHHSDRVAAAEAALVRDAPGVVIAGASVRGVGVPACIRQGREAAQAVVSHLDVARH